ncbi:hypothetical protein [Amycolatopsis speibonae]|uniref:Uncharacterized protein n=1 Tax=Amycolatopsis speibonae TaxID=1450224 RepID=A0ABV7P4Q3_9PSEU
MPRFQLREGHDPIDLFSRKEGDEQFHVDPGQKILVPGELAKEQPAEDAWIVGEGDDARAWAKSQWELVEDTKPAKAAPVKEN